MDDVMQGQRTSQLQFSKNSPFRLHDMAPPRIDGANGIAAWA
jgi:hypothetical protein